MERLIKERDELGDNISILTCSLMRGADNGKEVPGFEAMMRQLTGMRIYKDALTDRIELFKG